MTTLVITVIGDDRPGLVSELATVVAEQGGSWSRSQLAELAGKFAGIVTVDLPADKVVDLTAALEGLDGALETSVHEVSDGRDPAVADENKERYTLELVGNDRPGIVRDISAVLAQHALSIEELDSRTSPTPESGGELFEATLTVRRGSGTDLDAVRAALEALADELMVDLSFATHEGAPA